MNKPVFYRTAILCLFAAFVALSGFTPVREPAVVAWLTSQDHDFGEISAGRPVRFVFRFKNAAAEPILLQTARTSCGCTAAEWTEEPVAPGAEGQLSVEYDALKSGDFEKKIRVFFDKQRKPEILWIRGTVKG